MLYHLHEARNAALWATHAWAKATEIYLKPYQEDNAMVRVLSAASELVERGTRIFPRPQFGITSVERKGTTLQVIEKEVTKRPFCTLRHFTRTNNGKPLKSQDPTVLIVAPLAGHFATLLRGTVQAMLKNHEVYITDWHDAKEVPLELGEFTLNHYIDYILDFIRLLGENIHIIAVCQPSVPVLAAAAILAENNEPCQPASMTLMGGPIDTRINPGPVNMFSKNHSREWFEKYLITTIPSYYVGGGRRVCPGFIMLNGFMGMNYNRHTQATRDFYQKLIKGDEESAEAHRRFYDEYRAVLDMPADYFLDSLQAAFQDYALPRGKMRWRGQLVKPQYIKQTALMTVEGELDDISCPGQTKAAHKICSGLKSNQRATLLEKGVGHYGIFNGRRWRDKIQPKIAEFIQTHNHVS